MFYLGRPVVRGTSAGLESDLSKVTRGGPGRRPERGSVGCEAGCPAGGPPRVVCGLVRTLSIDSCTDPRRGKRCRGESGLVTYRVTALGGTHAPPAPGHVNGAAQSLCAGWVHQEVYGGHTQATCDFASPSAPVALVFWVYS